uniref:Alpha-carbonic anhydrase domain-containing protein n=1 Tax=Chromera velia CCMP2878 TaxID=1169474 RepID=A0A0G4ICW1_9ALVE|eukprot:Cvel_13154.t1-p1 / transcript=Cvel_13154.t1 / gene=Cvel_13154 / organism=Chromera_velia_CCMP2878 / gene_product=hypothetical protein / transcript_product=hypothetical protein / location=Cvel_scaffold888:3401-7434(-) / protein_length=717 / sequence_SO=supercontig / SO=protein_coding / is_pseudo=false
MLYCSVYLPQFSPRDARIGRGGPRVGMKVGFVLFLLSLVRLSKGISGDSSQASKHCGALQQSPITLEPPFWSSEHQLKSHYGKKEQQFRVENNGRMLRILPVGDTSSFGHIRLAGKRYDGLFIDVHAPAEHLVELEDGPGRPGKRKGVIDDLPLELQLFHRDNSTGRGVALSLLFRPDGRKGKDDEEESDGEVGSTFLERLVKATPLPFDSAPPVSFDLSALVKDSNYFSYSSPFDADSRCTQKDSFDLSASSPRPAVDEWIVFSHLLSASPEQFEALTRAVPDLRKGTRKGVVRQEKTKIFYSRLPPPPPLAPPAPLGLSQQQQLQLQNIGLSGQSGSAPPLFFVTPQQAALVMGAAQQGSSSTFPGGVDSSVYTEGMRKITEGMIRGILSAESDRERERESAENGRRTMAPVPGITPEVLAALQAVQAEVKRQGVAEESLRMAVERLSGQKGEGKEEKQEEKSKSKEEEKRDVKGDEGKKKKNVKGKEEDVKDEEKAILSKENSLKETEEKLEEEAVWLKNWESALSKKRQRLEEEQKGEKKKSQKRQKKNKKAEQISLSLSEDPSGGHEHLEKEQEEETIPSSYGSPTVTRTSALQSSSSNTKTGEREVLQRNKKGDLALIQAAKLPPLSDDGEDADGEGEEPLKKGNSEDGPNSQKPTDPTQEDAPQTEKAASTGPDADNDDEEVFLQKSTKVSRRRPPPSVSSPPLPGQTGS